MRPMAWSRSSRVACWALRWASVTSRSVTMRPDVVGRFSCSMKCSRPSASRNWRSPAGAPVSQGAGPSTNPPLRPSGRLEKRSSPSSPTTQRAKGTASMTVWSSPWRRASWRWRASYLDSSCLEAAVKAAKASMSCWESGTRFTRLPGGGGGYPGCPGSAGAPNGPCCAARPRPACAGFRPPERCRWQPGPGLRPAGPRSVRRS